MATDLHTEPGVSVTSLLRGIVSDAQDLIQQQLALFRAEIKDDFRKTVGITLQQYGLLVRLDHARGMLWSTDLPIAEIAAETGFADQSHLTRALSAHSAWSPLRLRWLAPCLNKASLGPLTPSRYDHVSGGQSRHGRMLMDDLLWSGHSCLRGLLLDLSLATP